MTIQPKMSEQELEQAKVLIQIGKISLNILHDLINPITGLTLYLESIKDEKIKSALLPISKSNDEIKNFIKTIQETVDDPNKIEFLNLDEIIKSSLFLVKHKAKRENVILKYGRSNSNLTIKMSRLDLYQIILNLIGNSIDSFKDASENKYKNERKVITISFSENKNNFRLSFVDNGSGIKKSSRSKIFDKKFSTKPNGFGIGLTTIKNVVENKLGGEIKLKSKWGEGTKFHIYIPKKVTKITDQ